MQIKRQQLELNMEQQTGSKLGKGYVTACIVTIFNLYAEYIMRNTGLEETQAGIKIARRNINNHRYADNTTLMEETGKGQFSLQSQRKAVPKNAQTTAQLHSSHTLVK